MGPILIDEPKHEQSILGFVVLAVHALYNIYSANMARGPEFDTYALTVLQHQSNLLLNC